MISSFFPSSLSSPQHWSRLSERLIAALFQIQRRSFKYWRMSSNTASNGRTWHYIAIGSIKSGGNIPPKPPLLIHRYSHRHHFTVVPRSQLVEQYDTEGIIKILPINSHIEWRPLARPLSLLSLQSQWLGSEWPDGKSCHYALARFISGCFPGQMRSGGRQDPIAVSVHPPSDLEVHPPSDLLPRPKDLALVL